MVKGTEFIVQEEHRAPHGLNPMMLRIRVKKCSFCWHITLLIMVWLNGGYARCYK